jgi:hypothetical protein
MSDVTLREYLELRFDALDERLERIDDHEDRIRMLEKARPFRTLAEAITGIIALVAMFFGVKNQ